MNIISIIICSRRKTLTEVFLNNIMETIGCNYELIIIDNSENSYSIFEAYNLGIEKSKGEFLCFAHDDILFRTLDWGLAIIEIFNDNNKIGLIGIAGAKIKTKISSAWWDCPKQYHVVNVLQHTTNNKIEKWNFGFRENNLEEVAVIDGVFMAMSKIKDFQFQKKLNGFHNYDLNISFEMKKYNKKIVVTNRVLIEHFSIGSIDVNWLKSTYQIHNLYKNVLGLAINENKVNKKIEISNGKNFIAKCLNANQYKLAFSVWLELLWLNPLLKFHLKFVLTTIKKIFI